MFTQKLPCSAALLASAVVCLVLLSLIIEDAVSVSTPRKPKGNLQQNCTNHLQMIDRCSSLATYSYTTSLNPYPTNVREMKASCDRIVEGLKCLKTHGKCAGALPRRAVSTYSSSRSKHSKRLCHNVNDSKSVDFLRSIECINKENKTNRLAANEKNFIRAIQYLAENNTMKFEDRFNNACCSALTYRNQVLKDIEPECGKYRETQEDMVNSMLGELIDNMCPESNRLSEICPKLQKLVITKEWRPVSLTKAALDLVVALDQDTIKET